MQGFGLFTLVQSTLVVWASIYWVRFPNFGEFSLVLLIAFSMALVFFANVAALRKYRRI